MNLPFSGTVTLRTTRGVRGLRPHAVVELNLSNPTERHLAGEILDFGGAILPADTELDADPISAARAAREASRAPRIERERAPARLSLPRDLGDVLLRMNRGHRGAPRGAVVKFHLSSPKERLLAEKLLDSGADLAEVLPRDTRVDDWIPASELVARPEPIAPSLVLGREQLSGLPPSSQLSAAERAALKAELMAEVIAELDARGVARGGAA